MTPGSRRTYLLVSLVLFLIEVVIAGYGEKTFVRPFLGDVLVVALLYALTQAVLLAQPQRIVIAVVGFACLIEVAQYFDFVALLGLQNSPLLSLLLGRTFSWLDFLAYFCGGLLVVLGEKLCPKTQCAGGHGPTD